MSQQSSQFGIGIEKEVTSLMFREPSRTTLILAKAGGAADGRILADRLKLDS